MEKKKILICGRALGIGGVEKALVALLNSFDLQLYDIDLLLMIHKGELIPDVQIGINWLPTPKNFDWINLRKEKIFWSICHLLSHPVWLYAYLKNILYGLFSKRMAEARQRMWEDCIKAIPTLHGHYDVAFDFAGLLRKYVHQKVNANKKYTWVHSDYRVFGYSKVIDEPLLRQFDGICCVTHACKEIFDAEFPALVDKSIVVRNIIDRQLIERQTKEGVGFQDNFNGIRLLDITRIDPNKGLDIAVIVCRRLKERGLNFRWYILGNDPLGYQKTLEKLIKLNGVEQEFCLLGFTTNPYPYIAQSDIVVHFSRFEGRSVAIDEAMALCKPILLTNYSTAKDQIESNVNGIICDFDEDKLVETITTLILSSDLRNKFAKCLCENQQTNSTPFNGILNS